MTGQASGGTAAGKAGSGDTPELRAALARSLAFLAARRPADALALLSALPPDDPRVASRRAYAHALTGAIGPSISAARLVADAPDADAGALDLAGNALTLCHRPADAYPLFRRAADLAPGAVAPRLNLAAAAAFLGRVDEAEGAYDAAIAADPAAWEAWRARSDLRRQTPARNHVAQLESALARGPPPEGETRLAYALGKELEDLGDHDRAFASFDRGARRRRAGMRYDVEDDIAALDLIGQVFDGAYCAPAREAASGEGAIFILGLPRTGSTLLERMLGRHPRVQALGELQAFGAAMVETLRAGRQPSAGGKLAAIRASAALDPAAIGARYLAAVAPLRDDRPRFTDKLPLNVLYAGLIARALPSARVVHLTREPVDACLAIYKTLFDEAYPYSYDLAELGRYHNAYRRLAAHWRSALGPRFIEIAYERLVGDPAAEIAALLARLGLHMDPACLNPEANASPVMTASAAQVREAPHARSVNLSQRYRRHLGPLVETLAAGPDGEAIAGAWRAGSRAATSPGHPPRQASP